MKETGLPLTTCATQKDKNKIDCGQLERQSLAAVLLDTTLQINVYICFVEMDGYRCTFKESGVYAVSCLFRAGIQESKPGYPTPAELKEENKKIKFRP
jgi:hypothetical protein